MYGHFIYTNQALPRMIAFVKLSGCNVSRKLKCWAYSDMLCVMASICVRSSCAPYVQAFQLSLELNKYITRRFELCQATVNFLKPFMYFHQLLPQATLVSK